MSQTRTATKPTITPITSGVLPRELACGQHTSAGGECEERRKKRLQQKEPTPGLGSRNNVEAHSIVHGVLRSPELPLDEATRDIMKVSFDDGFRRVSTAVDRMLASATAVRAGLMDK